MTVSLPLGRSASDQLGEAVTVRAGPPDWDPGPVLNFDVWAVSLDLRLIIVERPSSLSEGVFGVGVPVDDPIGS